MTSPLFYIEIALWILCMMVNLACLIVMYKPYLKQKTNFLLSIMIFFLLFLLARICVFVNVYLFNYSGEITHLIDYPQWFWMQVGYTLFSYIGLFAIFFVLEREVINTKYTFCALIVINAVLSIINYMIGIDITLVVVPFYLTVLIGMIVIYFYIARKSEGKIRKSSYLIAFAIFLFEVGLALSLPEARSPLSALGFPPWSFAIFGPVLQIIGLLAILKGFALARMPEKEVQDPTILVYQRDSLIKNAETFTQSGEVRRAIKLYKKAQDISKTINDVEIYKKCEDKIKELKSSLFKIVSTFSPVKESLTKTAEKRDIHIARGGEIIGSKIVYKVKIENNTNYNITDISVHLVTYPKNCIGLSTNELRVVPKIEAKGFRSLEFEFEPSKDCVQGDIQALVTYIDQFNKSHTESVQPFTIRSVCDLLKPYQINEEEFDKLILGWQKTGEFRKINENIYALFERSKSSLTRHNFHLVSSRLDENEGNDLIRGVIKAFAKGKYAGKQIGMFIEILGTKTGELSRIKTSSTSEDEGLMAVPISEIANDFHQTGLILNEMTNEEKNNFTREKFLQALKYLLIIYKTNGVSLYSRNFGNLKLESDLLSGFLSAITSFGSELTGGQNVSLRKMEYETLKLIVQKGDFVDIGMLLDDFPEEWLDLRLKAFVKVFEDEYKNHLLKWTGDIQPFSTTNLLFNRIFGIT